MSEKRSRKVRKTESPEDSLESKVESPKSEERSLNSGEEKTSAIDTPQSEIKEPLTTHNSPLTTMEVHHHPEVEKKGFKEYVLEGLMIFLAVTMGFFAESLRENITNNEHVKQLSVQLM